MKTELKSLVKKSLFRNHYNDYVFRLSFTISNSKNSKKDYFKSLQKMFCPYSLSNKVPSKHFLFSRFYLNKQLNYLKVSGIYK